ncbi:WD repeat-containing protein 44 [Nymphaea thermarum]|nr:WD repeat-containing protein 44 [Nymphaea thermarum]
MRGGMKEEEEDEEEERFFDSREEIAATSDALDYGEVCDLGKPDLFAHLGRSGFEVWLGRPESVRERRERFLRRMGLDRSEEGEADSGCEGLDLVRVKRVEDCEVVEFWDSDSGSELSSGQTSTSSRLEDSSCSSMDGVGNGIEYGRDLCLMLRIRNLDDGSEFMVDENDEGGDLGRIRELRSDRLVSIDEFHMHLGLSPIVQRLMRRDAEQAVNVGGDLEEMVIRRKRWLGGLMAAIASRRRWQKSFPGDPPSISRDAHCGDMEIASFERVKVHRIRKRDKEFSAVYRTQEIQAHTGAILTMKFSIDGEFLATAGEDGVVRVWQVIESERSNELDLPDSDSACVHFTSNKSAELIRSAVSKDKRGLYSKKKSSACVVIPPRVFRLSQKPIHEFHGHSSDVLDLSWSQSKCLLSSSMDKTVRLWQLGSDKCLNVFPHNNYVTCVQFNPVEENYFISGSLDGKVRIWSIPNCQVVDWADIRDIVTAVSYSPDGQRALVGSMTGNCRFYDASGHCLQLDTEICFEGKKKSPGKRITGFQFHPDSTQRVMVTSADCRVRIIDQLNIVSKYKGFRNPASQISASFTSNGRHIISASEDSHVYMWTYESPESPVSKPTKSIRSCERFYSRNVSVAMPWCSPKTKTPVSISSGPFEARYRSSSDSLDSSENGCRSYWDSCDSSPSTTSSSPNRLSVAHGFFSDGLVKGSVATWPEEKLLSSSLGTKLCRSQCKFLKIASGDNAVVPYAWGSVIVSASWDGRISSFQNFGLPTQR